jgi:FkbM family methyltransferase
MVRELEPLPGVRYSCSSELEEWRASTLLTKEPETIAWLDAYLGDPARERVLFDVGANVGIYSVYAAARHGCDVYAFEPVVENFTRLEVNRALNTCERLHPFQIAVGARNGLVDLFLKDARIGNSGAQIHAAVDEVGAAFAPVAARKVLAMSLDSLAREFGLPCPTLIKIDIDGHEDLVLEGAAEILGNVRLVSILVELNSGPAMDRTARMLAGHGFARDATFDALENHSSKRRRKDQANVAQNGVFSRKAG